MIAAVSGLLFFNVVLLTFGLVQFHKKAVT
jgi:hypothetical protein